MTKQDIRLNFFPIESETFSFYAYKKKVVGNQKKEKGIYCHDLPIGSKDFYFLSFEEIEGFEEFLCLSTDNPYFTIHFLNFQLFAKTKETLSKEQFFISSKKFETKIHYILKEYNEGFETVTLEAYYLPIEKEFGFLVDYKFKIKDAYKSNTKIRKKISQYNLVLDNRFNANKNYYSDKFDKIEEFKRKFLGDLFPITITKKGRTSILELNTQLKKQSSYSLDPKVYLFSGGQESNSQFNGLKKYGPLKKNY